LEPRSAAVAEARSPSELLDHGQDARGRAPADVEAHRQSLRALDINPLLVLDAGRGVVAVDWLIELA